MVQWTTEIGLTWTTVIEHTSQIRDEQACVLYRRTPWLALACVRGCRDSWLLPSYCVSVRHYYNVSLRQSCRSSAAGANAEVCMRMHSLPLTAQCQYFPKTHLVGARSHSQDNLQAVITRSISHSLFLFKYKKLCWASHATLITSQF